MAQIKCNAGNAFAITTNHLTNHQSLRHMHCIILTLLQANGLTNRGASQSYPVVHHFDGWKHETIALYYGSVTACLVKQWPSFAMASLLFEICWYLYCIVLRTAPRPSQQILDKRSDRTLRRTIQEHTLSNWHVRFNINCFAQLPVWPKPPLIHGAELPGTKFKTCQCLLRLVKPSCSSLIFKSCSSSTLWLMLGYTLSIAFDWFGSQPADTHRWWTKLA